MKVFVSHAHEDRGAAREMLYAFRAAGFDVFDPEDDLAPGDNRHARTGDALDAADALVVLISPASMESTQVRGEISYSLGDARFEGRLFPVVVVPTDERKIPWILRRLKIVQSSHDVRRAAERVVRALRALDPAAVHEGDDDAAAGSFAAG